MTTNDIGMAPSRVFKNLSNDQVKQILPSGAFELIAMIDSNLIESPEREKTFERAFWHELIADNKHRRATFLSAIPDEKLHELEMRMGISLGKLDKAPLKSSSRRNLLGFLGMPTLANFSASSSAPSSFVFPAAQLFPHQKKAASDAERYLYFDEGRVMLHLPTGVGKTRTAMSVVTSHLRIGGRREGTKKLVLWLASTSEILEQAANEFEESWTAAGDRPIECLRFWSNLQPPIDQVNDGIIFASLAKLHSYGQIRKRLWNLGDRTTMVVFDEAHQAVAETYHDIVETIVSRDPRTPLLGLSATPGRTWNTSEEDASLAKLFKEKKVTVDFGEINPITYLTESGYLAKVSVSLLNVIPGLSLSQKDMMAIQRSLDIPDSILTQLGSDEQRNLRILEKLQKLAHAHSRILVFAASVDNAILLTSACRGIGLTADVVTSKTSADERRRTIAFFKQPGKACRILINFGVLTTGFDAPKASAALIARPTKSLVLYSQMVGRVIRGPKAGGTEHCEVITVVDTSLPGFDTVANAFANWEDQWS